MGSPREIGLVYDLLGSAPAGPPDADAEYEPIETVEALEGAIRHAGHVAVSARAAAGRARSRHAAQARCA
jgi:D-alanine-D-alanine ligase